MTATTATSEPVPRAVMSTALPICRMSDVPIATTSPVSRRRDSADPSRPACRTVTCTVVNIALR